MQSGAMKLPDSELIKLLETMLASRMGDLREQSLIRQGKGLFHVAGMGHEALAAIARYLHSDDYLSPYYRDRALTLARGMTQREIALMFYAKRASGSGGRQMPQHYSCRRLNILPNPSAVPSNLLPACGVAWGLKMDGKPGLVFASCGDAATREGEFFEAISFAVEKQLPVLIVVEDNGLGISSFTDKINPLALGVMNTAQWVEVDASSVEAVDNAARKAVESIRAGNGPAFLWCRCTRLHSHSSADDQRKYRGISEIEALPLSDPIERLKQHLVDAGALTEEAYAEMRERIEQSVREVYTQAEEEEDPSPEDFYTEITGDAPEAPAAPRLDLGAKTRVVDAVNATLLKALDSDPRVILFGQDIEDPKGGVFSITKGLSAKHPERVFNSPLAEATILGVACGLAYYGKLPIFEIQFIDFIGPGWNQLVHNLATVRWRTYGDWKCPMVIYAPSGAYLPGGGPMHSQTNEAFFAHQPGLNIAIPSTPEDAAGLFWSGVHGGDPTMILVPKHLLWREVAFEAERIPLKLGQARLVKPGRDLTLVAWGNTVELAEEALRELEGETEVELIDLRSIVPCDVEAVAESVARTGRLVVVQEDSQTCSVGQMLLSTLISRADLWEKFKAPPVLVSKGDVCVGFNPIYEYGVLPTVSGILTAIRGALRSELLRTFGSTQDAAVKTSAYSTPAQPKVEEVVAPAAEESAHAPSVASTRHICVPQLGEGITNARVAQLLKKPGDVIRADDSLCELETDKALFPVESPFAGVLKEWLIKEEDAVEVGQEIVVLEVPSTASMPKPPRTHTPPPAAPQVTDRILPQTAHSLLSVRRPQPNSEGGLAPHIVSQLKNVVPAHMTVLAGFAAIRTTRAEAKRLMGKQAPSPTAMTAWCVVRALEKNPIFRCTISLDDTLAPQQEFDFGIAVSLANDALETAVVPRAGSHDWAGFLKAYEAAVTSVRGGKTASKVRTPLILTSMGQFNVRFALPVVVPPSIATLFVGEAHYEVLQPGADPKEVVNLCLSFDHRWINGVAGSQFLTDVKTEMESFSLATLGVQ